MRIMIHAVEISPSPGPTTARSGGKWNIKKKIEKVTLPVFTAKAYGILPSI